MRRSIPESSGVNELGRQNSGDNAESFDNYARELERRKRKTEAKRRQDVRFRRNLASLGLGKSLTRQAGSIIQRSLGHHCKRR